MSITPNYPCLITSAEPDRSWEGFSATEKISWLGVGGGVLDGEQSRRAVVDGRIGGTVGLLLTLTPPPHPHPSPKTNQEPLGSCPNRCLTTTWAEMKPHLNRRGEKRKRVIRWPPLWECCKLCFSWSLGNPTPELEPAGMENGACLPRERRCQIQNNITWSLGVGELAVTHSLCCAAGGQFRGLDRKSKYYNKRFVEWGAEVLSTPSAAALCTFQTLEQN